MNPLIKQAMCLLIAALTLGTADARAQRAPQTGAFTESDRARAYAPDAPATDDARGCVSGNEQGLDRAKAGTYSDNDAAHYARGSVLVILVFVDHLGGSWNSTERSAQAVKSHDAKLFYLDHKPSEGLLTFDHEQSTDYFYYRASVPYDINDYDDFHNWMITDAAEDLGFADDDADGSVIDEMTIYLQNWNGGWDNVIAVFIPADYNFENAEAGWSTSWCKLSHNMSYGTWAHEWGHVFGACDEGGGPAGCNDLDCDDVCMSYYLVDQVPNGNCVYCTEGVDCVMRAGWVGDPPCSFTYRNWGWVDANDDGRLDNTIGWDPFAQDLYEIHELYHDGWMIHTNETWGMTANQKWTSWSAIGVRSRGSSDWSVSVYADNNLNHHLAADYLSDGVRFVVGDFNHNNLGRDYVRLINTGGNGQYVLSYEAGNQVFYPDGVERAQSWDDKSVVRAYDVPLFAGETIQFQLDIDTPALDLGMALFNSNGGIYYAPRTSAVWQENDWPAGISESYTYTVPADDVYGLVVWSDTEVDGTFSIKIGPTLLALDEADPTLSYLDLRLYSYAPYTNYWAVSAVRPGSASNVTLRLFAESTFETLLATSGAYPNVEFIAADYNPGYSTDYLRVSRVGGVNPHTTEWEQGSDILAGFEENTWEGGHVGKVWDAHLLEGQTYRFQQYGALFSPIDVGIYLMSSADGGRYVQRSGAEAGSNGLSPRGEWFTYTALQDDWYGFVTIANDESEGDYSVGVGPYVTLAEQSPVDFPDEIIWADVATQTGSWAVVGVRPESGSQSSMWVWGCEDRFFDCYLDGDALGDLVRYLVIDGNHTPSQTYYTRADRVSGLGRQAASFDIAPGNDLSFDDPDEIESASGSFVEHEVVQIWDLNVAAAPIAVRISVLPLSSDLDIGVATFGSGGGEYIQGSDQALASVDETGPGGVEQLVFDAPNGDIYGLVITNRTGVAGEYEINVYDADLVAAGDPALPQELDLRVRGSVSAAPSLELSLPDRSFVQLEVFDVMGRRIQTLADEQLEAGLHAFAWDGSTVGGGAAGAGVYLVRLRALEQERTLKLVRQP